MITWIIFAIGCVMVVEGLVYVLAPSSVERMLEALREFSLQHRRIVGALIVVIGLILIRLTT